MDKSIAPITRACGASLRLLAIAALVSASAAPVAAQAPEAQFTKEGTENCMHCHGGERMVAMGETVHGKADNPHTPFAQQGCESCHGPGSLHVSRARGGVGFPAMLRFNDEEPAARQNEACTACHAQDQGELKGMAWAGSVHDDGELTCVNCHDMHTVGMPLLEKDTQLQTCSNCHKDAIASHPRFEDKGIVFDRLSCHDCHDVHQLVRGP